jgi:hypothetical protein
MRLWVRRKQLMEETSLYVKKYFEISNKKEMTFEEVQKQITENDLFIRTIRIDSDHSDYIFSNPKASISDHILFPQFYLSFIDYSYYPYGEIQDICLLKPDKDGAVYQVYLDKEDIK